MHEDQVAQAANDSRFNVTHPVGAEQNRDTPIQEGATASIGSIANEHFDVVVAGFGPAALAIAIAIHDELENRDSKPLYGLQKKPKIAFLERQTSFGWHSGMLIEGSKMQISFIKDLATIRNPRSKFTFLNYLHQNRRLIQFSNLNTFLPTRVEFDNYLAFCAKHFREDVFYGQEVLDVSPSQPTMIDSFFVRSRNIHTQEQTVLRTRHVIIAVGGKPFLPKLLDISHPQIIHSSLYMQSIPRLLVDRGVDYRIAVIGSGQSAAEVFDNLRSKHPICKTHLIMRQPALRPSDDSPFVNEIFDPKMIQPFYDLPKNARSSINSRNRNTNYGVVRLELLEKLYETLYLQRLSHSSEEDWPHRILPNANIESVCSKTPGKVGLEVNWCPSDEFPSRRTERFYYDAVVVATGYVHNGYEDLLHPCFELAQSGEKGWSTGKDYHLHIQGLKVQKGAGIWLQGCNEETHGLSDTLLSGLAVRAGIVVQSIFGNEYMIEGGK